MSANEQSTLEFRRLRRVLGEIAELAQHASLTGSFQKAGRVLSQQYNSVVQHLQQIVEIPSYLFVTLPEDASMDEIGVSAKLLSGYLEIDEEDSHSGHPEGKGLLFTTGGLKDLKELKDLGRTIREHLPDWLGQKAPEGGVKAGAPDMNDLESRLAGVGAQLQAVAQELSRSDLTDEQRSRLAEQISGLAREQSQLAQQIATLKQSQGS